MKHLHYVQSLEPLQGGGLGTAALQLHHNLSLRGGSALVATRGADFSATWPGVHQVPRSGLQSFYYSKEMAVLARTLVADSDWVHGHGLHVHPSYVFGRECRRQGKKSVLHVHGFLDPWIARRSQWKKRLVGLLFENRNFAEASFLRALTSKEESQIRMTGYRGQVAVVPNGIELEEADLCPAGGEGPHFERKRPKRILFLSRIHPKKGLDLLVPAWARLASSFPDWELAIVGPDEGGYAGKVREMIREGGVEGSCTVLPSVFGQLKHQVFRTADLFVLPSHSEGFPMSVLEALAHRIPTVVTTECNVPEIADAGGVWQCLPEGSEIEKTLRLALMADDSERLQRASISRTMLEQQYTWQRVADSLEAACLTNS